jgi:hypothetical protein
VAGQQRNQYPRIQQATFSTGDFFNRLPRFCDKQS